MSGPEWLHSCSAAALHRQGVRDTLIRELVFEVIDLPFVFRAAVISQCRDREGGCQDAPCDQPQDPDSHADLPMIFEAVYL